MIRQLNQIIRQSLFTEHPITAILQLEISNVENAQEVENMFIQVAKDGVIVNNKKQKILFEKVGNDHFLTRSGHLNSVKLQILNQVVFVCELKFSSCKIEYILSKPALGWT